MKDVFFELSIKLFELFQTWMMWRTSDLNWRCVDAVSMNECVKFVNDFMYIQCRIACSCQVIIRAGSCVWLKPVATMSTLLFCLVLERVRCLSVVL